MGAAERAVFTAPGAVRMYQERYPKTDPTRLAVIPNGYDEASFVDAERIAETASRENRVVLLHSGVLYPSERDPRSFYRALARLLGKGRIGPAMLRIVLRSTGHDRHHRRLIEETGSKSW